MAKRRLVCSSVLLLALAGCGPKSSEPATAAAPDPVGSSSNNGAHLTPASHRVAVFGDSNWEPGTIAAELARLVPELTFVNVAQGGSGKNIPAMTNDLQPPLVTRLSDQGPFDAAVLGMGTNDGRCNRYSECTSEPYSAEIEAELGQPKPSWCPSIDADPSGILTSLDTFLRSIGEAQPELSIVMAGPAPTFDPAADARVTWCVECGCGYTLKAQPFMGELSQAFAGAAEARRLPFVDLYTPLLSLADAGDAAHSAAFPDGVHYAASPEAVSVAAAAIADVLRATLR